jgi:alpha-glucosidase
MKKILCCLLSLLLILSTLAQEGIFSIESPDKKITVQVRLDNGGQPVYNIRYGKDLVLDASKLGIVREDGDFSKNLTLTSASAVKQVSENYTLFNAKRYRNSYRANRRVIQFKNAAGQLMDIIFQISNDGVAFRYYFPGKSADVKKIEQELTSFHFPGDTKGWLQPMSQAKTGWQQVNPCYEEFYEKGIDAGKTSRLGAGWVFPALFQTATNHWLLITEAAVDSNYCAAKLDNAPGDREYHIAFPDPREVFPGGAYKPQSRTPWYSPWRIICIGSLATIAESTLGTDLAPAPKQKMPFAQPGKASWSWAILKDDSITYAVQKRFIDYAADMNWQYCLIDVNWDTMIGLDSIQLLVDYAKQKNVGIWLWYNSAGSWNTTPYHPRDKLLTHASRVREFSMLQKMGVAGIKIDFFGGDGQSVMKYYIDILRDAAKYKLMVNFHGATLPRGWQRTYPNLMTAEAVKGFEYVTFDQKNADEEPAHCTVLPFTRNAFDPMDFTPMSLDRIPRINRQTTAAFELALSVIFLSGVQHFAETPEGMSKMPEAVKNALRELPTYWDDVKFIEGFPGKYVVLARNRGNRWWIAGINGENTEREISLDLSTFKARQAQVIKDGEGSNYFTISTESIPSDGRLTPKMKPLGGFFITL